MGSTFFDPKYTPITQAQYAYNELRRAIASGVLAGGTHIVQSEWAEKLDVSITPIREAIRRLEQDGLAQSVAHKGTMVIGLSMARAEEICQLRRVLDPMQLQRANCRLAGTETQARELCLEMNDLEDPVQFSDLDIEFHRIIMGLDDSWTARFVHNLTLAASPYVSVTLHTYPEKMAVANEQHFQMLDAAVAGDLQQLIHFNAEHNKANWELLRTITLP